MDSAWLSSIYSHSSTSRNLANESSLQRTWDRSSVPSQQMEGPFAADPSLDFMDALATDEALEAPQAAVAPFVPPAHGVQALPAGLTDTWRPPTPSRPGELTLEQLELHRQIAAAQDDQLPHLPPLTSEADASQNALGSRAAESVAPPRDDERSRTGAYALNPEDALRAVWDGPVEAERARQVTEASSSDALRGGEGSVERGKQVAGHVLTCIGRGTYVDDVYGLPPLLAQAFKQATSETQDSDSDAMRARAIARLEALTRHLTLSDTDRQAGTAEKTAAAENWLRRN
ncbi:hypothetical protein CBOM_05031 [Ceraceosorus bombacis]|uniref:Uncharacterized protein n=1 Tax=Ceraceosorus bombacis TaxID=401625 RepID=A0A0P1BJ67_9BASI|nr:hypothetical protein CBOM_05031 [Ceraceosorus bombacis]